MSKVFVRWYNEVVEGTIVKEDDMFGMTVVEIPVQGVKVKALYSPKHIYKTVKEACGEYPKTFPTPETFQHPSFANVGATVSKAIDDAKEAYGEANKIVTTERYEEMKEKMSEKLSGREHLDKFLKDHWDHEHNHLQLDYWQEYDRMFFNYMRRKLKKDKPQQSMETEYPATPEECTSFSKVIIPSTDLHDLVMEQYIDKAAVI